MPSSREPTSRPGWDDYFAVIASAVARRADCRRARHGCVLTKHNRIIATGYNGGPAGSPKSCLNGDCPRGLITPDRLEHNTADYTNCIGIHAEQNAVSYARFEEMRGATAYITGPPCDLCKKLLLAAGIHRIVYPSTPVTPQEEIPHAAL